MLVIPGNTSDTRSFSCIGPLDLRGGPCVWLVRVYPSHGHSSGIGIFLYLLSSFFLLQLLFIHLLLVYILI